MIGGRYELLEKIGEGGMGAVYEAVHVATYRRCALKLVHDHLSAGHEAKERFLREVRAPAAIGHEGLVEVLDAGVDEDGTMFLAMELLVGQSLREILDAPDQHLLGHLRLFLDALEPLAAAHARGFVHRDMKPENIFVLPGSAPDGRRRVKLLDFGIARQLGDLELTETGIMVGSTKYISPEQARSARDAVPASDLWSVGVMLYEASSGRLPFAGESAFDVIAKLHSGEYTPLSDVTTDLPPRFVELVHECLRLDPRDRPASAGVLGQRLLTIVRDEMAVSTIRSRRVFSDPPPPLEARPEPASYATPAPDGMKGPRAKGTNVVLLAKTVRAAMKGGLELDLTPQERVMLDERLIISDWYPYERFAMLLRICHEQIMSGSVDNAVQMGEIAGQSLLSGVHASFVRKGDVLRTLKTLPRQWKRYFDFGDFHMEPIDDHSARMRLTGYDFMPEVHGQMIVGWVWASVRASGGEPGEHRIERAPYLGNDDYAAHFTWAAAAAR